jgi:hypothetical protein
MAEKKTPFGGKKAAPFGSKQGAKEDTRAKKATTPKKIPSQKRK